VFFDVRNLVLCLTRELIKFIDYKIMLKLQCKTTFYSAFVGKKYHQNRTRVDFGIMFLKNVFYMKYMVKTYSDRILFARLCINLELRPLYIYIFHRADKTCIDIILRL
jgi:hypothetical protein